jgi:hypothetical protein
LFGSWNHNFDRSMAIEINIVCHATGRGMENLLDLDDLACVV